MLDHLAVGHYRPKMTESERENILGSKSELDVQNNRCHLVLRLLVTYLVCFLSYMAIWLQSYCINEWIQNRIKISMFGNETLDKSFACSNHTDPDYTKLEHVQQEAAKWSMYCTMTLKSVSLITTFILTVYTDVYGRRFLFILSCFSITLFFALAALVVYYDMDFVYLILANAVYGLTGTSYALLAVTYSYIADITVAGKERAVAIFCADVTLSIAGTSGAFITGIYIERTGFIYPCFTAAGISFVGLLVAIFCIPESIQRKHQSQRPNFRTSVTAPFKFYTDKSVKGLRRYFILLLFAFIFSDMTGVHRKTTETLYQLGMPFCWTPSQIGLFATINALAANILGIIGLKVLQKRLTDAAIAFVAISLTASAFVFEAMVRTDVLLYLVALPACLSNLPVPLIRSTMSTMASKQQQGALSASLLIVQTVCSFVTGIIDNSVYAATLPIYNGFIFFVFAGYCLMTAVFLGLYLIRRKQCEQSIQVINEKRAVGDQHTVHSD